MTRLNGKYLLALPPAFLAVWAALKYLFPLAAPFAAGAALAWGAEPVVRRLSRRLSRGLSAGVGVTLALTLTGCLVLLLGTAAVKELTALAGALPELTQTARGSLSTLEGFLLDLSHRAPEGVRPLLDRTVKGVFSDGSTLVDTLAARLPGLATSALGKLPGGALALGTGLLSAYMISARLPALRRELRRRLRTGRAGQLLPVLRRLRGAIGGWLKAQLGLMGVCFAIVCAGFLLLRIPWAPLWALVTALVDAVPILGTGTLLLPWSLSCLLQGQGLRAAGLLGTYVTAALTRSILEPRLVGRQLGLDPLVTLIALYGGFRIWGIPGMLLSPMICVALSELFRSQTLPHSSPSGPESGPEAP